AKLHKKDHQAASGLISLGVTSEEGSHPQLSSGYNASANFTAKVDPEIPALHDSIPHQQDEPFIVLEKSSEEYDKRNEDTHAEPKITSKLEQDKEKVDAEISVLKAQSMFLNINQLTDHLVELLSMVVLDKFSFSRWPAWGLDALVLDSVVCLEDCFLLSPFVALSFFPWGTFLLVYEEVLGALGTLGTYVLQTANICLVKGGP
nr:hypothetical protein [Tanacetum cinerariifolium]